MLNRGVFSTLLLFVCFSGFAQKNEAADNLNTKVKNAQASHIRNIEFVKTSTFFLEHQWDSLIYATYKQLDTEKNPELIDYLHFYRGVAFWNKQVFEQAYTELALVTEDFKLHSYVLLYFGAIRLEQQQFRKSLSYFQRLLELGNGKLQKSHQTQVYHNIGLCYLHLEQFDSAEQYLKQSTALYELQNDTLELIGAYGDLAGLYYEQYKDELAIPYFEKAYELSGNTRDFLLRQNTALNMAIVEENREEYGQALVYRKQYEQWRDSLNDQSRVWELAQIEKKLAIEQKERQVQALKADSALQKAERNRSLILAAALLLLLVVGAFFYRDKARSNRLISAQKEELSTINDTKDRLFSIVSHDLRSSLNGLKSNLSQQLELQRGQDKTRINELLQQGSKLANSTFNLVDNLFHWALLQTQQSFFESEPLKLYYMVEQAAFDYDALMQTKIIGFHNDIPKATVVLADQGTLKIILRNLLDNAIKYTLEGGTVTCHAKIRDFWCTLVVEDTGIGMSDEVREVVIGEKQRTDQGPIRGTGLGLQLVRAMVLQNQGTFDIKSTEGRGVSVFITLPTRT